MRIAPRGRGNSAHSQELRMTAQRSDVRTTVVQSPVISHVRFVSRQAAVVLAVVIASVFVQAQSTFAKTLVVSKDVNCWPQVKGPLYPTIQSAINAMPTASSGVNIVLVCPGTYPEQVVINKNITIQGALRDGTDPDSENGNSAEARIVVPAGGLVPAPFGTGYIAAQIVAQNILDLNIINMTVDGHGGGCPTDPGSGLPVRTAGIALSNVGVAGTASEATISKNNIHSMIGYRDDGSRCYSSIGQGEGVVAENSWFVLDSNSIHDHDLAHVHQIGGVSRIKSNSIGRGYKGIQLTNVSLTYGTGTGSTVSLNDISNFSAGIQLEGSSNVLVSQNNIGQWGAGIWLSNGSSGNDVLSNRISDAYFGIDLGGLGTGLGGHFGNVVKENVITRSTAAGVLDVGSHGTNSITNNTINDAPIGIFYLSTDTDVFTPNTFYNVRTLITTGATIP
jgi:hypothetical protein